MGLREGLGHNGLAASEAVAGVASAVAQGTGVREGRNVAVSGGGVGVPSNTMTSDLLSQDGGSTGGGAV